MHIFVAKTLNDNILFFTESWNLSNPESPFLKSIETIPFVIFDNLEKIPALLASKKSPFKALCNDSNEHLHDENLHNFCQINWSEIGENLDDLISTSQSFSFTDVSFFFDIFRYG